MVDDRLNKYLEEDQNNAIDKGIKRGTTDWVNKRVEKSTFGERIARRPGTRSDLKFKPGEYIALICHCHGRRGIDCIPGRR